jgi:DNA invertase Pin-like site-specific DNA recombinase
LQISPILPFLRHTPSKEKTMLIGYARVSTEDQKLHLQHDALRAAGCDKIYDEKVSGAGARLPARMELLEYARPRDVAVVWKLDRLGRSLRDLVEIVTALKERDIGLRSLHESIDTTTSVGKLTFHIFAALSEFEADVLRERTCPRSREEARSTQSTQPGAGRDGANNDGKPETTGSSGRRAAGRASLDTVSQPRLS